MQSSRHDETAVVSKESNTNGTGKQPPTRHPGEAEIVDGRLLAACQDHSQQIQGSFKSLQSQASILKETNTNDTGNQPNLCHPGEAELVDGRILASYQDHLEQYHGSCNSLQRQAVVRASDRAPRKDDIEKVKCEGEPEGLIVSNEFDAIDKTRAPLKKKRTMQRSDPTTLVATHTLPEDVARSTCPTPLLRETSSSFAFYPHHERLPPPPLRLTMSRGLQLMSEPLLQTPNSTARLWPQLSASSIGSSHTLPPSLSRNSCLRNFDASSEFRNQLRVYSSNTGPNLVSTSRLASPAFYSNKDTSRRNVLSPKVGYRSEYQHPSASISPHGTASLDVNMDPARRITLSPNMRFKSEYQNPTQIASHHVTTHAIPAVRGINQEADAISSGLYGGKENHASFANITEMSHGRPVVRDLFTNVSRTDRPCKCSHSRCLKLYCECFHHGFFCDDKLCRCKGCLNNEDHNQPRGFRIIAMKKILARRPNAFAGRVKKHRGKSCGCKKSGCLKKYCDCVALNRLCTSACKCIGCMNSGTAEPSEKHFGQIKLETETAIPVAQTLNPNKTLASIEDIHPRQSEQHQAQTLESNEKTGGSTSNKEAIPIATATTVEANKQEEQASITVKAKASPREMKGPTLSAQVQSLKSFPKTLAGSKVKDEVALASPNTSGARKQEKEASLTDEQKVPIAKLKSVTTEPENPSGSNNKEPSVSERPTPASQLQDKITPAALHVTPV